jgi:GR25 family glycosyltransferase involved in LPS biosynthesis
MIDGCLVINLPHRTDRWKLFQEQIPLLTSLGLNVERMDAVYGRMLPGFGEKPWFTKRLSVKRANAWGGKAGCTLSHRNAIATAKERGWKNVLIVEDDVSFDAAIAGQWERLVDVMNTLPDDWIAVYLYGHHPVSPIRVARTYSETVCYEFGGAISAAAYIINGKHFESLLRLMPANETIWSWTARHKTVDRWYLRQLSLLGRIYAMAPFGIVHLETPSDTTTAGAPYHAPSFKLCSSKGTSFYYYLRNFQKVKNRLVLSLSRVRYLAKRIRGL